MAETIALEDLGRFDRSIFQLSNNEMLAGTCFTLGVLAVPVGVWAENQITSAYSGQTMAEQVQSQPQDVDARVLTPGEAGGGIAAWALAVGALWTFGRMRYLQIAEKTNTTVV